MSKPTNTNRVPVNSALAIARHVRSSPRKLNLVAQLVRGKPVGQALNVLEFCEKAVAEDVRIVLQSAIANAENNHNLDVDLLVVSEATVGKTLIMKRFRARAKGRGAPIQKPFSNLRIVVQERAPVKNMQDA